MSAATLLDPNLVTSAPPLVSYSSRSMNSDCRAISQQHAAFDGMRFCSDLMILCLFATLSVKKIWLIGKSPYLRYWEKCHIPGFLGFYRLHPFASIFPQSIKYQEVAQNISKKVLITGGVSILTYKGSIRAQKAVISNSATPTLASFTPVTSHL